MRVVKNAILLFGMFAIAYNVATALHELGHVVGVTLGGGAASHVKLNPFTWSYTYYASNPSPLLAVASGPAFEILLSVALVVALLLLRIPVPRLIWLITIAALAVNAVYLGGSVLGGAGDGADLVQLGVPSAAVFAVTALLMLGAGALVIVLQPKFGVAYNAGFGERACVIVGGVGSYLVLMLLYVACLPDGDLELFVLFVGAGLMTLGAIVVLATMLQKVAARLSPAVTTVDASTGQMFAYLIGGILVIVAEILVFGV